MKCDNITKIVCSNSKRVKQILNNLFYNIKKEFCELAEIILAFGES
jgi:hypothetical protein